MSINTPSPSHFASPSSPWNLITRLSNSSFFLVVRWVESSWRETLRHKMGKCFRRNYSFSLVPDRSRKREALDRFFRSFLRPRFWAVLLLIFPTFRLGEKSDRKNLFNENIPHATVNRARRKQFLTPQLEIYCSTLFCWLLLPFRAFTQFSWTDWAWREENCCEKNSWMLIASMERIQQWEFFVSFYLMSF